jgi:hypothetical protein
MVLTREYEINYLKEHGYRPTSKKWNTPLIKVYGELR